MPSNPRLSPRACSKLGVLAALADIAHPSAAPLRLMRKRLILRPGVGTRVAGCSRRERRQADGVLDLIPEVLGPIRKFGDFFGREVPRRPRSRATACADLMASNPCQSRG